jgi:hypothetical protein
MHICVLKTLQNSSAFSSLAKLPASTEMTLKPLHSLLPVPQMDKDTYLFIKFWLKKDYLAAKKNCKNSIGFRQNEDSDNKMTWYVETEDGDPVDGDIVEAIHSYAWTIWRYLWDKNMAPATWSDANLEAYNLYEHHMCHWYLLLALGADNWKAHMIATDNYSSWYLKNAGHNPKLKSEHEETPIRKRSHSPSLQRDSHKKGKQRMDQTKPLKSPSISPGMENTSLPSEKDVVVCEYPALNDAKALICFRFSILCEWVNVSSQSVLIAPQNGCLLRSLGSPGSYAS